MSKSLEILYPSGFSPRPDVRRKVRHEDRVYAKGLYLQTQRMQGSDSLVRCFRFLKREMEETDWHRMAIRRR